MASQVPQVTKLDPTEIPSVGCVSVKNVEFKMNPTNSANFSIENFPGCDAIVFACYKEKNSNTQTFVMTQQMKQFDKAYTGSVCQKYCDAHNYQPTMGNAKMFDVTNCDEIKHFGVIGMGYKSDVSAKNGMAFAKEMANMVKTHKFSDMYVVFPDEFDDQSFFQAFMESFYVCTSPHMQYVSNKKNKDVFQNFQSCTFTMNQAFHSTYETTKIMAQAVAEGMYAAAELVNAPANYCNTVSMANFAVKIAQEAGMTYKVMDVDEIEAHGMGAYMNVAKGSFYPPKFIHLTYKSNDKAEKKICFVGKGIVFDSGGYNLKPVTGLIELMKFDMGGAAAVFGAAKAIGKIKPKNSEFHFVVAAAENMISSKAYRPGDIVTASNGKTIEIGNTDAEGRLALCDSIVYCEKMGADVIIDFATLTGACMVALGMKYAGLWSSDDKFASEIKECAESSGELMWQMPLAQEYKDNFSSKIADINNIGKPPQGGAIVAALFLSSFVEKAKWAHVDLAGPVFDHETGTGTGFGVKTIVKYAMNCSQGKM